MSKPAPRKKTVRSTKVPGAWRMKDLPAELQDELRDRLEEAKRGDSLIPFDEALAEAEQMADEIVAILNRADTRRAG
jgi:hypothetical protein